MTEFNRNSFATIQFTLTWKSGNGIHEEKFLARKINAWRDVIPAELKELLMGAKAGETIAVNFPAGSELPDYASSKVKTVPQSKFRLKSHHLRDQPARIGRFYPQGTLRGLPGVYPQTISPLRVLDKKDSSITADLNHPLAGIPFRLEAEIINVADKDSETGGRLTHWIEELCDGGPGMQAPLQNHKTDFIHEDFFKRDNDADDKSFYASPRLTGHIDEQASRNLQNIYAQFLRPEMKVLDLMSSMQSHLPQDMDLDLTGLGMNMDEMRMNPVLNERVVQDLNIDPELKFTDDKFDAITCSMSIEYLTDPLSVLKQAYSNLHSGGHLIIGVSNRWFPTKVTQGWLELHEFERMGYLLQLAEEAGFTGPKGTTSIRNDWRPTNDRHFVQTRGVSDPVYVVWCKKIS
ncbi:methyltransferase domain-containing protein [Maridesulfovibrio sp.]|uniref:methyltransferase domain-containing protein n=1 Tax=Maridesulfovibrio sp. TaxID=2795000 RepID=UPI0029CA0B46|nr:methyltransferase domain-containing protein [Maridesulfovibrio sp.]